MSEEPAELPITCGCGEELTSIKQVFNHDAVKEHELPVDEVEIPEDERKGGDGE